MIGISQKTEAAQILVTIAAFVIVVAGMIASKVILVPFLLAAFIAIISSPPLFWLQRKGLPPWLALLNSAMFTPLNPCPVKCGAYLTGMKAIQVGRTSSGGSLRAQCAFSSWGLLLKVLP